MLLYLYNLMWYAATPLIRRYLRRRARRNPDYALHWDERFGKPYPQPQQHAIWLHAVSVGETHAAAPVVAELRRRFPDAPLLITQMTPTGRATAQKLFPDAQCRYLPYDRADWVHRFLREHKPRAGIIMETEIWPNLFQAAAAERIPLFLANARLSAKSQRGYAKIRPLIAPALASLSGCLAQTDADARRLQQLGANRIQICGNSKYDIAPPPESAAPAHAFRQRIGNRRVFIAASTREKNGTDEAALIMQAWRNAPAGNSLLVIVPRHPERFQAAYDTAAALGFTVQKRSDNQAVRPDTQIWIGDSMGEMPAYYQAADIAFVGGTLVDTGGQNIIEPMACGKAVLFGTSIYNFQAACEGALSERAAVQISDAAELADTACRWLADPAQYAPVAARAAAFVVQHQGASRRITDAVATEIAG